MVQKTMMLNTKWLKGRHTFIYFYKDCGKAIIREGVNNKKPTLKKKLISDLTE